MYPGSKTHGRFSEKSMRVDRNDDSDHDVQPLTRVSTGVPGVDNILNGGLIGGRSYLVNGEPGTGKTILGLHYLLAGAENGETSLFINLEESTSEIEQNAATLGFDLADICFLDLSPESALFTENRTYDVFESSEVENSPFTEQIAETIRSVDPDRVFVDPLTQLRHLSPDEYQFRQQILSFIRLVSEHDATVLFTTQDTPQTPDDDLQFMSDGTIELGYASTGRSLRVPKFRGSDTVNGTHAMRITDTGLEVYPQLTPEVDRRDMESESVSAGVPEVDRRDMESESVSAGVPEVDELLNGGLERGTVTVISGPTGVGKTTTGTQFMKEAAGRGDRSVIYLFEESKRTFYRRSEAINIPVRDMIERGTLNVEEVEALQTSPQEFAQMIRHEVEQEKTDIVMIDGINGYKLGLKGSQDELLTRLHTLNRYLKRMGVTVILIDEVAKVTGEFEATEVGISYLADNILFLRHLELDGEMRKAIGVLKKRASDFERTLREFAITEHGIKVGEPLTGLHDILSGTPKLTEATSPSKTND